MQVSVETTSTVERRLTVGVPADKVENAFSTKLGDTAKKVRINGFRPGKAPLREVQRRFGDAVRAEVIDEIIRQTLFEAISEQKLNAAGQPTIESIKGDNGQDLEYVALVEVYPEISLASFAGVAIERPIAEVTDADVDTMIDTLRKQRAPYIDVQRPAQDGDMVKIDYVGTLNGEAFEGGSANDQRLVLGSKQMIPGFEDGLLGASAGEERTLSLTFPEDYQNKDLAGKVTEFKVKVNEVSEAKLPEVTDEFVKEFGVDGGVDGFKAEVKKNMTRELRQAIKTQIKAQVLDNLAKLHEVEVPKSLVKGEIGRERQRMMQQFGMQGQGQINPDWLPDSLFEERAKRSVQLGLIVGEVIRAKEVKPDATRVRQLVDEMAETYEQPEEVVQWYYSNREQMAQVEALALEDQVIDLLLGEAQLSDVNKSYMDVVRKEGQR